MTMTPLATRHHRYWLISDDTEALRPDYLATERVTRERTGRVAGETLAGPLERDLRLLLDPRAITTSITHHPSPVPLLLDPRGQIT